ncbi:DNA-directed DNA polymerase [Chytriomyces confervae]|uniref:DNA-directed DNA polymerase n=1 Tax=Chytriomyces confervae TaxID=246404 RepID=A0A507DQA1_9FUNG|nr:DNA-directed DNA polymerase [Chytriomyces confervae]
MNRIQWDPQALNDVFETWGITRRLQSKDSGRLNQLRKDIQEVVEDNLPESTYFRKKLEKHIKHKPEVAQAIKVLVKPFENPNPFPDEKIMIEDLEEVPKSVKEAQRSKYWEKYLAAMKLEMNQQHERNCFGYIKRSEIPPGHRLLRCKWVFDLKIDLVNRCLLKFNARLEVIDLKKEPTKNIADTKWVHKRKQDMAGVFEKYKSRLVVRGFTQVEGVDYDKTFAPVVRSTTIKVLISVSLDKEYRITQMDVVTVYLNSKMDYNLVIRIPDGYKLLDPNIDRKRHALRLLKGLYGTKQGGYLWNEEFKGTLISIGFKQSVSDPGLFRIEKNRSELLITLYVDNILIATDNEDLRKWKYKVKFMGEIHTLLGSVISYDRKAGKASIQQSNYIESIRQRFGLENTKYRTPLEDRIKLPENSEESTMEKYRSLLGAIMYASVSTRPDVAYATAYLGQFASKATEPHWNALKRLTGYLVNTSKLTLQYKAGKAHLIEAWVDASHLSEGAYGVSGQAVFVGGNLVSWRSRKQKTVALSSMEAEVNALVDVLKEVMWLRELLTDMGVSAIKTVIFEDNQAAIASSKNVIVNNHTRHMLGKTTFVREAIKEHNIELVFILTKDQKADGLTKAKGPSEFEQF